LYLKNEELKLRLNAQKARAAQRRSAVSLAALRAGAARSKDDSRDA
jgi:hypothetical protein